MPIDNDNDKEYDNNDDHESGNVNCDVDNDVDNNDDDCLSVLRFVGVPGLKCVSKELNVR